MKKSTQDELKRLLKYNPKTGEFIWCVGKRGVKGKGSVAGSINNGIFSITVNKIRYSYNDLIFLFTEDRLPELTQEKLKRQLIYNPDTGLFVWKINKGRYAKIRNIAGNKNRQGYIRIVVNGLSYDAHSLAFLWMNGCFPDCSIEHKNKIRSDNRWENLIDKNQRIKNQVALLMRAKYS